MWTFGVKSSTQFMGEHRICLKSVDPVYRIWFAKCSVYGWLCYCTITVIDVPNISRASWTMVNPRTDCPSCTSFSGLLIALLHYHSNRCSKYKPVYGWTSNMFEKSSPSLSNMVWKVLTQFMGEHRICSMLTHTLELLEYLMLNIFDVDAYTGAPREHLMWTKITLMWTKITHSKFQSTVANIWI